MDSNFLFIVILFVPLILFLIIFSGIMSGSETALTSINLIVLKNKIRKNKKITLKKTKIIYWLLNNYNYVIAVILILNTLINTAIATLILIYLTNLFQNNIEIGLLSIINTILTTLLLLIFSEITPKILAKKYSEQYFLFISWFLYFLARYLFFWLLWFKFLKDNNNHYNISEEELLELINVISNKGILEIEEEQLVKSAIKFDDKTLSKIFIPKKEVKFLYHDCSKYDILEIFNKYKYTRIPIINRVSKNVIGYIYSKDIIYKILFNEEYKLEELMQQPLYIEESVTLNAALTKIQETQNQLIIVLSNDYHKNFIGIVTCEDIVEEVVGKIYDEKDKIGLVREIGKSKWYINSKINLKLLMNDYLKINDIEFNSKINLEKWFLLQLKQQLNLDFSNINELIKNIKYKKTAFIFKNYVFKIKNTILVNNSKNIIIEIRLLKSSST